MSTYISPPFLPEAIVWEWISRGRFEPNLEHVRGELRARRDAMLGALARQLPGGRDLEQPRGRLLRLARPRRGGRVRRLRPARSEAGVAIVPGPAFFPRGSGLGASSARLAYSYETPARIAEGIELLGVPTLTGAARGSG